MPNITLANGGNGNLLNDATFKFNSNSTSSGRSTGYLRLNLALSDLNLTNHTIKITANGYWHTTWSSATAAWDYNSGDQYFKLYTTGTSSSSGTNKTYYLYKGGNKKSYGTLTGGSTYFNGSAADHCGNSSTYYDINRNKNTGGNLYLTLTNATTVDLAKDNSLTMSIACSLSGTSGTYGPINGTQSLGTYTLTINPQGAVLGVNDNGTGKRGSAGINDNGTGKPGTSAFINNSGTGTKNS